MLTGTDDSALIARKDEGNEALSREAQLNLLREMADDYRQKVREIASQPKELEQQLERLDSTLRQHADQLASTEADYKAALLRRRDLRSRIEAGQERREEIDSLLERFDLLGRHYMSDLARLLAIEEAGTLFNVLGHGPCPLCGAAPEHQHQTAECEGDTDTIVAAARAEAAKIELLQVELAETVLGLKREAVNFDRRLPRLEGDLSSVTEEIQQLISPKLTQARNSFTGISEKRSEVREALTFNQTLQDIEQRRERLLATPEPDKASSVADGDLPSTIAQEFADTVEGILEYWHFPGGTKTFFDPKTRDLVIGGKHRAARGKGLRAITHAAFTIALLAYCRSRLLPHPGFVIVDSPLLAYRAPEGLAARTSDADDVELAGTNLDTYFYKMLLELPDDRQVIVFENTTPSDPILSRASTQFFSGNIELSPFGFFPPAEKPLTAS